MSDLLDRLAALAAVTPCRVRRADLLRLLTLAGLAETYLFGVIADGEADPVTVDPAALVATIWMARRVG